MVNPPVQSTIDPVEGSFNCKNRSTSLKEKHDGKSGRRRRREEGGRAYSQQTSSLQCTENGERGAMRGRGLTRRGSHPAKVRVTRCIWRSGGSRLKWCAHAYEMRLTISSLRRGEKGRESRRTEILSSHANDESANYCIHFIFRRTPFN